MVIFHNWAVSGYIYTADVSISKVTDVFRAQWNRDTLELRTSIPLDRVKRGDVLRAFARLCLLYEGHKVKLGELVSVAWG